MKTGLIVAAALVPLALAQPKRNNHKQIHKRQVVTDVQYVTTYGPDVVVYVNAQGVPTSTSTAWESGNKPAPATLTSAPAAAVTGKSHKAHKHHGHHGHHGNHKQAAAPAPAPVPDPVPQVNTNKHHHHHHNDHHQAQAAAPAPAPAPPVEHNGHPHHPPSSSSSSSSSGSAGSIADTVLGMVYSPYNSDGSCKTQSQVDSDFGAISGYGLVRIYGTDCDQVNTVGTTAKAHNMKVMAGVFDLSDVAGDVQMIISGMKSDWAGVDTVVIGNELVNSGLNSVSEVVAALNLARPLLRAAGFQGPVVTVDTFNTIIANPELCQASDYAAANAHAFFDSDMQAPGAGAWAKQQQANVQKACNGMKTVITESGWPHQGTANGQAVPSQANQAAAISSLKSHFASGGLVLFTAYDDLWKPSEASTFYAEQFWGIYPGQ